MLPLKEMLQRLSIALQKVKAGNPSENLINEVRQIIYSSHQQDSRVLYTFVLNKIFGQLLDNSPKHFILLKTFNPEFLYIEVSLTDKNSKLLETEDKMNITLVINQGAKYKI